MAYAVSYALALVVFAAIDITWLMTMGGKLYRQTLGDILLTDLRMAPAAAFYLMYPAGLVIFAVAPALKSGSPATALLLRRAVRPLHLRHVRAHQLRHHPQLDFADHADRHRLRRDRLGARGGHRHHVGAHGCGLFGGR